jgi:hypothetical protein
MEFWMVLYGGLCFLFGWVFGESQGYDEAYRNITEKNLKDKFGDDE